MLTPKQQAFVEAYLVCLSAKDAAIKAGYSARTAKQQGSRLLTDAAVAAAIKAGTDTRKTENEATAERVIGELARIAFSDIRGIFTADGRLKSPADLDDVTASSIASIEVVTRQAPGEGGSAVEYVHKIKTVDKNAALANLGRYFALFTDKTELTGKNGAPVQFEPSQAAARIAALMEAARSRKGPGEG